MPSRTVEVVAGGPPPVDPYAPGASAWALASALSKAGDDVHVLYLPGSGAGRAPAGVTATVVEIPLHRPGAPIEPAEFAQAAGKRLRPGAELVVRDPVGLGGLGLSRRRRGPPLVAAFVRGLEIASFEGEHRARNPAGVVDRLDTWRDHRAVRRLEKAALDEADRLFPESAEVATALTEEYGVPSRKLLPLAPAVPTFPDLPSRGAAREELRVPQDVPVVMALAAFETPEPSGVDRVLEAFRRVRPFFPGVRLVLWGVPAPTEPGLVNLPERTEQGVRDALASADVALFLRRAPGFDPGIVLAARAGIPAVVLPDARVGPDAVQGLRTAVSDDPGDIASTLAELLADPAVARDARAAARTFAEAFEPGRVAEAVVRSVTPVAA